MSPRSLITIFLLLFPVFVVFAAAENSSLLIGRKATMKTDDAILQHFSCIMRQVQPKYQFQPVSLADARPMLNNASLDGYVPAMPDDALDSNAIYSAPLRLENWYWFWHQRHDGPDSTGTIRYGVIKDSFQSQWLTTAGYKADAEARDLTELISLLSAGLVDVILADLEHFNDAATQANLPLEQYRQRFSRYVPLGVYFSKQQLEQQPSLLRHFNATSHLCAPSAMELATSEKQKITALLIDKIRQLTTEQQLLNSVQQQNRLSRDVVDIMQQDQLWQQQLQQANAASAEQMLQSELSGQLQQWKKAHDSMITEVILMDNKGANVAISRHTPDYWQGDESIFLSVFEQQKPYAVSPLEYNPHSQRIEVYLSVPVINSVGHHIGALAVGVDVGQALSSQ